MLNVGAGEGRDFLPPAIGGKIQVHGTNEISDAATLVSFLHARPEAIEFEAQQIGFVEQHGRVGKQIEDGTVGPGHGGVELPARKNRDSAGAHRGIDNFFRSLDAFAREAGVDCAQQLIADGSLGERQEQRFIHGVG